MTMKKPLKHLCFRGFPLPASALKYAFGCECFYFANLNSIKSAVFCLLDASTSAYIFPVVLMSECPRFSDTILISTSLFRMSVELILFLISEEQF